MTKLKFLFLAFVFLTTPAFAKGEPPSPFLGEKITYSIKQLRVKAGEAVLSYIGPAEKDGKKFTLITFKADGMNFLDEEQIFADPKTLLPQIVVRNLNIFGQKEKITEYYDAQKGQVRIIKIADGKTTEQVIEKKGQIDNIYCFIYRYRREGKFQSGQVLETKLPTMDLKIKVEKETKITAGGKKYRAYYLESDPSKYKLWFAAEDRNLPLRIDGAVGVGSTSMTMLDFEPKIAAPEKQK